MLKKNALRRICISTFSLFIVLLLCIFPSNETSYPEEIISINELTMPLEQILLKRKILILNI